MGSILKNKKNKRLKEIENKLNKIYYNPKHPASFSGINKLYKEIKKSKPLGKYVTLNIIKSWLSKQKTYTLHKPIKRKFKRRKTISAGIDYQWQADLADLQKYSKDNNNYRYLLCVIDVFSKYAWVIPIKNKTGQILIEAFESILKKSNRIPKSLQTDKGSEFKNKYFQKFLKEKNIHFFTTENPETKASIVERFQRTLKAKMWKYFTHKKTRKYIDKLNDLVYAYNHSYHRSIKMTPSSVNENNEVEVTENLFGNNENTKQIPVKVGDLVRINKTKKMFDKGYLPNWTTELFKIYKIINSKPISVKIKDLNNDMIEGSFYLPEIQTIKDNNIYDIDSVVEKRTRIIKGKKIKEIKVHWRDYPSSFDSWIPETNVI